MNLVLHEYQNITSTSVMAQDLSQRENVALPFAVIAEKQTAGKGRQGHQWLSPTGNVYVTLAFDPGAYSDRGMSLVPLRSAVLIAEWLESRFHISPMLKWPNDLLIGGRKLAGILCETSIQGHKRGPLFIGIGCNLNIVPEFTANYRATSLAELCGKPFDTKYCARDLCHFFYEHFSRKSEDEVLTAFSERGYKRDERLFRGAEPYAFESYADDGSLNLRSLLSHELVNKAATDESLVWHGQYTIEKPILVADVGNTATKIARFNVDDEPTLVSHFINADLGGAAVEIAKWLESIAVDVPVYVASVNDQQLHNLKTLVGDRPLIAVPKRRIFTWGSHYDLIPLGMDRLATIEAATASMRQSGTHRPILCVSAGTAVTIDLISAEGEHLGGWICAGPQTAISSLAEKTAALPTLQVQQGEGVESAWGREPRSAILCGANAQAQGLLAYARDVAARTTGIRIEDRDVYLTGGYASFFQRGQVIIDPNLTLKGVRLLAMRGTITD